MHTIYIYIYKHRFIHMCKCVYIYIYIYIYTHTYITTRLPTALRQPPAQAREASNARACRVFSY